MGTVADPPAYLNLLIQDLKPPAASYIEKAVLPSCPKNNTLFCAYLFLEAWVKYQLALPRLPGATLFVKEPCEIRSRTYLVSCIPRMSLAALATRSRRKIVVGRLNLTRRSEPEN